MYEAISTFLLAPFVGVWILITASWWIGILFSFFFIASMFFMSDDDHATAFVLFVLGAFLSVFCMQFFGTKNGLWDALTLALSILFTGLGYYAVWGLLSVLVLWILEAMKFRRKYAVAREVYTLAKQKTTDEKLEVDLDNLWRKCMAEAGLKHDVPLDAKSSDGIWLLSSFFFLWPVHLVNQIFGEVVRQIPHILSMVFGGFLNSVSKLIAGRREGRPID